MNKDKNPLSIPMRRKDRAVEDKSWIQEFLHRAPVGFIATVSEGKPLLHPTTFVYDRSDKAIFFHTAIEGRTRSNIETDSRISFCVAEMGRLLPGKEVHEFSVEYASVVIFGKAEVVKDLGEAKRAMQMLLDKYFPHLHPGQGYRAITVEEIKIPSVFRINIEEWSGKRNIKEGWPDGAFYYINENDIAKKRENRNTDQELE